jgi:hypothetical protein
MSGNQFLWCMMFMFFSGNLEDTTYVYHLVAKSIAAQKCSRLCFKKKHRKKWRGTVGCMGTWALRTWLLTFTENQTWCSSLGWCEVVWTVGCKMCLSYHNMTLNGKRWATAPKKNWALNSCQRTSKAVFIPLLGLSLKTIKKMAFLEP